MTAGWAPNGPPEQRWKGRARPVVGREAGARLQPFLSAAVTVPRPLQRKEVGARDTANLGTVTLGDTRAQQPDTTAGDTTQNFLGSPDAVQRAGSSLISP